MMEGDVHDDDDDYKVAANKRNITKTKASSGYYQCIDNNQDSNQYACNKRNRNGGALDNRFLPLLLLSLLCDLIGMLIVVLPICTNTGPTNPPQLLPPTGSGGGRGERHRQPLKCVQYSSLQQPWSCYQLLMHSGPLQAAGVPASVQEILPFSINHSCAKLEEYAADK